MKLFIITLFYIFSFELNAFEVGVKRTKCSLSPEDYNDPCGSLYNAICDGKHCKCPPGTHESQTMKNCQKGPAPKASGSGGDDLFDLPFDYVPGKTPAKPSKPTTPSSVGGVVPGAKAPTNTNWNINPGQPQQPGGYPQQPPYNPNQPQYPNQPGAYPNQPGGYPQQPAPGYPNQPSAGYPGGYPNQPGGYPYQPSSYPNQPTNKYSGGDPRIGEKAGGGIGGGIGLIVLIGIIYLCCRGGGKGKNQIMNLLSRLKGGGGTQPMPGQYGGGYVGGGGYPMNQVHGPQFFASPSEQKNLQATPTTEIGK